MIRLSFSHQTTMKKKSNPLLKLTKFIEKTVKNSLRIKKAKKSYSKSKLVTTKIKNKMYMIASNFFLINKLANKVNL